MWAGLGVFLSGEALGDQGGRPGRGGTRGTVGWGCGLGWARDVTGDYASE